MEMSTLHPLIMTDRLQHGQLEYPANISTNGNIQLMGSWIFNEPKFTDFVS